MSTVLPVCVMMDTLGLIVEVISMSVNYLNQFVMAVVIAQTLWEVSPAHVQTHAQLQMTVMIAVVVHVLEEELVLVLAQVKAFHVLVHLDLPDRHAETSKVRICTCVNGNDA